MILKGTVAPQIAEHVGSTYKGTGAIDALRALGEAMEPLLLQAADGRNFRYWIIEALTNLDSAYLEDVPRRQEFQLVLRYYGESV